MTQTVRLHPGIRRRHKLLNLVHTWLLVAGSLALLALCAWALAGPQGVVWITIGGAISLYAATHVSPKMVLRLYRARRLPEHVFPQGHEILRDLARRGHLDHVPDFYLVPSRMLNAFSVGGRDDAAICVTDGLLRQLTLREFAAVMAHELSHVRNGDIRVMALADIVARMTGTMSMIGIFMLVFNLPALAARAGGVPWLAILLLMAAPTIGALLQLALSRTREYDADLDAVALTRDPEGLASALWKLEKAQGRMWEAMTLPGGRIPDPSLLRTHPKTEERVRRIRALAPPAGSDRYPDHKPTIGRSLVPSIGRPRLRARGLGHWY